MPGVLSPVPLHALQPQCLGIMTSLLKRLTWFIAEMNRNVISGRNKESRFGCLSIKLCSPEGVMQKETFAGPMSVVSVHRVRTGKQSIPPCPAMPNRSASGPETSFCLLSCLTRNRISRQVHLADATGWYKMSHIWQSAGAGIWVW
jgi:hypothetical protein